MRKYRILIAGHDPPAPHRDLREILGSAGHKIADEAKDGLQAVEMAKRIRPDLVIMDIMMPRMDGIAASKRITEGGYAPVLLLAASSQPHVVERAKDSGAMAYLVKPVQAGQLLPTMEFALSRWEDMKQMERELEEAKESLEARKTLDRAKGILMAKLHITEQEAYRRIRKYSMEKRKTIKEIAEAVILAAAK